MLQDGNNVIIFAEYHEANFHRHENLKSRTRFTLLRIQRMTRRATFALKQEYKTRTAMNNTELLPRESNKIRHSHNKRGIGDGRGEINRETKCSPATYKERVHSERIKLEKTVK